MSSASEKLKALDGAAHATPWRADGPNEWSRLELKGSVKDWIKVTRYNVSHHSAGPIPGWFGLAETAGGSPQFGSDAALIASLRNALPQIVAVVEAADKHCSCFGVGTLKMLDGSHKPCPTHAALAALDEALP